MIDGALDGQHLAVDDRADDAVDLDLEDLDGAPKVV
jgi:hypothetical protein